MAENNLDALFLVICRLNDALKYTVRYGTDDATAFEKQQEADKAVSLLLEKWEWNKPMTNKHIAPGTPITIILIDDHQPLTGYMVWLDAAGVTFKQGTNITETFIPLHKIEWIQE